jgi:hypothetical protein
MPSTDSPFPETPTLEAQLVRTEWGAYTATLALPDGHDETLAGDDLDAVREQLIDVARGYLRTQVGRPGRLRVQDPDGIWLLGVPLDDSDLVPLTIATISEPAAAVAVATPPRPAAAPRREPPVLPARPTITPRRPATPRKRRAPRAVGRRATAAAALLLPIVAVVAIADAVQGSSPQRAAHHAAATGRSIPTVSVRTPTVTGSVTTPITTPTAHPAPRSAPHHVARLRPRPRPRHTPVQHRAARARHATHHAAPTSSSSTPAAAASTPASANSTPSTASSTPASTTSTPTSSYTPPVSSYTPPAPTGGSSNGLPVPGDGPPPL